MKLYRILYRSKISGLVTNQEIEEIISMLETNKKVEEKILSKKDYFI